MLWRRSKLNLHVICWRLKSFSNCKESLKFRIGTKPTSNSWQQFPIIVNDARYLAPPNQDAFVPPNNFADKSLPEIAFYGTYPYQLYQYSHHPEEPSFILVTPKSKPMKKLKQTQSSYPKSTKKLGEQRPKPLKLRQAPKMDIKLVQAVQQPHSNKFVIEKFFLVPGRRVGEIKTMETVTKKELKQKTPLAKTGKAVKSQKLELQRQVDDEPETATVKVESVGMTAADQPIPDYSAFFPRSVFTQPGTGDEATLILEPISKAISGNDGTSISTPISRAILRKGTAVKVLFRPQSVAISGAYGVSHAQADLILDFIEDE